jgi:hypothetical protein
MTYSVFCCPKCKGPARVCHTYKTYRRLLCLGECGRISVPRPPLSNLTGASKKSHPWRKYPAVKR